MSDVSKYVIKHWAEDGERSGATVVVASSRRSALYVLKDYFDSKPNGYRQYARMDLLEIEEYDDSMFADYPLTDDSFGVKAEYVIEKSGRTSLFRLECDVNALADELDKLQAAANQGRGVSCVQTVVAYLRRGRLAEAYACVHNEGDKIRNYAPVVEVLKRIGVWYEIDFNSR